MELNIRLVNFLLGVDCASGGHCASIRRYDGQVGGAVVVWDKVLGLVVLLWMCGVIGDLTAKDVSQFIRGDILDKLKRQTGRAC